VSWRRLCLPCRGGGGRPELAQGRKEDRHRRSLRGSAERLWRGHPGVVEAVERALDASRRSNNVTWMPDWAAISKLAQRW